MPDEYVDPDSVTLDEGAFLVRLARNAVKAYLSGGEVIKPPPDTPSKLLLKGMSFVTIRKLVLGYYELRGCIGYLQPIEPLANNVINAAIAAATEDPRFNPLDIKEIGDVIFEVSVLSVPETIAAKGWDLLKEVRIGIDGLIAEYRMYKGLLLPEVPVEYCWDVETFLSETCLKAGMSPDCWLHDHVKFQRFKAAIFKELKPYGDIVKVNLIDEYRRLCSHISTTPFK